MEWLNVRGSAGGAAKLSLRAFAIVGVLLLLSTAFAAAAETESMRESSTEWDTSGSGDLGSAGTEEKPQPVVTPPAPVPNRQKNWSQAPEVKDYPPPAPGQVAQSSSPGFSTAQIEDVRQPGFHSSADAFEYVTGSGTYRFSKERPHLMRLSAGGMELSPASTFFVEDEEGVAAEVLDPRVLLADGSDFQVLYDVARNGTVSGVMRVDYEFAGRPAPKITATYSPVSDDEAFNVAWYVQSDHRRSARSESIRTTDGPLTGIDPNERSIELVEESGGNRLALNWEDAASGQALVGTVSLDSAPPRAGVVVRFPPGMRIIDPEIVASPSASDKMPFSFQRRLVFHEGVYFVFYLTSSSFIAYRTSLGAGMESSGKWVWGPEVVTSYGGTTGTLALNLGSGLDVDAWNGNVYLVWAPTATTGSSGQHLISTAKGRMDGRVILWERAATTSISSRTVGGLTYDASQAATYGVSLAVDQTGVAWVGASLYRKYTVGLYDYRDWDVWAMRAPHAGSLPDSAYSVAKYYGQRTSRYDTDDYRMTPVLVPHASGRMMLVFSSRESQNLHWAILKSSDTAAAPIQVTGVVDDGTGSVPQGRFMSAVGLQNGSVLVSYFTAARTVGVGRIDPDNKFRREFEPAINALSTSISVDSSGIPFMVAPSVVGFDLYYRSSDASWTSSAAFATGSAQQKALIASTPRVSRSLNQFVYIEDSSPNFPLKFAAFPLPFESSTGSSNRPWARPGASPGVGSVSTGTGILALSDTDFTLPSRGFELSVSRVYNMPLAFEDSGKSVSTDEVMPMADMGTYGTDVGWRLDLPWVGRKYLHLPGGQAFLVDFRQEGADQLFENRAPQPFRFWLKKGVDCGSTTDSCYILELPAGLRYRFWKMAQPDDLWRFPEYVEDKVGNRVSFAYSQPANCLRRTLESIYDPTSAGLATSGLRFSYDSQCRLAAVARHLWSSTDRTVVSYTYVEPWGEDLLSTVTIHSGPGTLLTTTYEYDTETLGRRSPPVLKRVRHHSGASTEFDYASARIGTEATSWVVTRELVRDKDGRLAGSRAYDYEFVDGQVARSVVTDFEKGAVATTTASFFDAPARMARTVVRDAAGTLVGKSTTWFGPGGHVERQESMAGPERSVVSFPTMTFDGSPFGMVHEARVRKMTAAAQNSGISWDGAGGKVLVRLSGTMEDREVLARRVPKILPDSTFTVTSKFTILERGGGTPDSVYPLFLGNAGWIPGSPSSISASLEKDSQGAHVVKVYYIDATGATRISVPSFALNLNNIPIACTVSFAYSATTRKLDMSVKTDAAPPVSLATGTYTIGSNAGDGFSLDRLGVGALPAAVGLETQSTRVQVDDIAFSATVSSTSLASEVRADTHGNVVYSKGSDGREMFAAYGNDDSRNGFRLPSSFDRVDGGKLFADEFEESPLRMYTAGGPWRTGGTAATVAPQGGELRISRAFSSSSTTYSWVRLESQVDNPVHLTVGLEVPSTAPPVWTEAALVLTNNPSTTVSDPFGGSANALKIAVRAEPAGKVRHSIESRSSSTTKAFYLPTSDVWFSRSVQLRVEFLGPTLRVTLDDGTGPRRILAADITYTATPSWVFLVLGTASSSSTAPATAIFDHVSIQRGANIGITGLNLNQVATLVDEEGRTQASARTPGGTSTVSLSASMLARTSGAVRVFNNSGELLAELPSREVYGGDLYRFRQPVDELLGLVHRATHQIEKDDFDTASPFSALRLVDEFVSPEPFTTRGTRATTPLGPDAVDGLGTLRQRDTSSTTYAYNTLGQAGKTTYVMRAKGSSSSSVFGLRVVASGSPAGSGTSTTSYDSYLVIQNAGTLGVRVGTATSAISGCTSSGNSASGWHTYKVIVDGVAATKTVKVYFDDVLKITCTPPSSNFDAAGNYISFRTVTSDVKFDYVSVFDSTGALVKEWSFDLGREGWIPSGGMWDWDTDDADFEVVTDPSTAFRGSKYHRSRNLPGLHQHSLEGGNQQFDKGYVVQWVRVRSDSMPSQVMLEFKDDGGSWEHRAYWGPELTGRSGTNMGRSEFRPAGWNKLVVSFSDVGIPEDPLNPGRWTIRGMTWVLYDGAADWDFTKLSEDPAKIKVRRTVGSFSDDSVQVHDESGNVVASTFVDKTAPTSEVEIDLYAAGVRMFPFKASIVVRHRIPGPDFIPTYYSPVIDIWGGEEIEVRDDPNRFYISEFPNQWTVNRPVGTLSFQNGREASSPVRQESYYNYGKGDTNLGLLREIRSSQGSGFVVSRADYGSIGPQTWLCSASTTCFGSPTAFSDSDGHATSYEYNLGDGGAFPRSIREWPPGTNFDRTKTNVQTSYDYDRFTGDLLKVTDHGGNSTSYAYDWLGRTVQTTYTCSGSGCPLPSVVTRTYDDAAGITTVSGDFGRGRTLYDGLGRPIRSESLTRRGELAGYEKSQYSDSGKLESTSVLVDSAAPVSSWDFCVSPREWKKEVGTWSVHTATCEYSHDTRDWAGTAKAYVDLPQHGATTFEWTAKFADSSSTPSARFGMNLFDVPTAGGGRRGVMVAQEAGRVVVYPTVDQIPQTASPDVVVVSTTASASIGSSFRYRVTYDPTDPARVNVHVWRNSSFLGIATKGSSVYPTGGDRIHVAATYAHVHFSAVTASVAEGNHQVAEWGYRFDTAGWSGTSNDGGIWAHDALLEAYRRFAPPGDPPPSPTLAEAVAAVPQRGIMTFEFSRVQGDAAHWDDYEPRTQFGMSFFCAERTLDNCYALLQRPSALTLYKIAGMRTEIAEWPVALGATETAIYRVTYDSALGKFDVWRNAIYVGSYTDPSPRTSGGFIGLHSDFTMSVFDDLRVFSGRRSLSSVSWDFTRAPSEWVQQTGTWVHDPAGMFEHQDTSKVEPNGNAYTRFDQSGVSEYEFAANLLGYDTSFNWAERAPATRPSARYAAATAYDSQSDRVVMFGGYDGAANGETWAYDNDNNTWTNMKPLVAPSVRYRHAMVYDSLYDRVVLFGGYSGSAALADTWVYDFDANSWTQMAPSLSPSARYFHAMAFDATPVSGGTTLLYGGYSGSSTLGQTWEYNLFSNTWTDRTGGITGSPGVRQRSAMAYDSQSQRIVLFGGYSGSSMLGDTYEFRRQNGLFWQQKTTTGTAPPARMYHTMAYDSRSDLLVLNGGCTSTTCSTTSYGSYSKDTFTLKLDGSVADWKQVTPTGTLDPRIMAASTYIADSARTVVFDGLLNTGTRSNYAYVSQNDAGYGLHIFAGDGSVANRLSSYLVLQTADAVEIQKSEGTGMTMKAHFPGFPIRKSSGDTDYHAYKATYDPTSGQVVVWRDGKYVGQWTDPDPLRTGKDVSFRTQKAWVEFDRLSVFTGAVERTSRQEYDATGRVTKVVMPDGTSSTVAYDNVLRLTRTVDPNGDIREAVVDQNGRTVETREYVAPTKFHSTHMFYDASGNLLRVANASADLAVYEYDDRDRVTETTYPDGTKESSLYDGHGLVTEFTDRSNQKTTNTYDAFLRLQKTTFVEDGSTQSYKYDYTNGITEVVRLGPGGSTTGSSTLRYVYDFMGRTSSETLLVDGDTLTTGYTYNRDGSIAQIAYPLPPAGLPGNTVNWLRYSYTDMGDIASVSNVESTISQGYISAMFGHRQDGSASATTYFGPSAQHVASVFDTPDKNGALARKFARSGAPTPYVLDLEYLRRPDGRMSAVFERQGSTSSVATSQQSFDYDSMGRLIAAIGPGYGWLQWTYDEAGNRLTENLDQGAAVRNYRYEGYNRLDTVTQGASTLVDYDYATGSAGRVTTRKIGSTQWNLAYTPRDEVKSIDNWGTASIVDFEFTYDASGRRIKAIDRTGANGVTVTTYFLYAGLGPLEEYVRAGAFGQGGKATFYTYAGGAAYMRTSYTPTQEWRYYITDHLGSTRVLLDHNGNNVATFAYAPFGKETSTPSGNERLRFTGEQQDTVAAGGAAKATGLTYLFSRYYDPESGRFISPDSNLGSAGRSQSFNRYSYVENDPINFNDPTGKVPHIAICAGVGALVGFLAYGIGVWLSGSEWNWGQAGKYTFVGALAGAGTCIAGPAGLQAALLYGAALGGVGGAISYAGEWAIDNYVLGNKREFNGQDFALAIFGGMAAGAVAGGAAYKLGPYVAKAFSQLKAKWHGWKGAAGGAKGAGIGGSDDLVSHGKREIGEGPTGGRRKASVLELEDGTRRPPEISRSMDPSDMDPRFAEMARDLEASGVKHRYGYGCSECHQVNSAFKAGQDPTGGKMATFYYGGENHGAIVNPCPGCREVMKWWRIAWFEK